MTRVGFRGGTHPPDNKEATAASPITWASVPERVVVPLGQHLGAVCEPLVARGDRVARGQMIGSVDAVVSAPVHASVTGEVGGIGPVLTTGGQRVNAVTIIADPDQDLDAFESIGHHDDVIAVVRAAGIVGLGGATFPTTVKLKPPADMPIDTMILNGCECEPYLTCDHRLMVESPERVVKGARIIAETVGARRAVIAVEDNKPDAVGALRAAATPPVEVAVVPTHYPQGAEKQLIWALLGTEVPHGKLPATTGALVHNVATAAAIADALESGKPLIDRVVTVTGRVARPGNYRVVIGTLISDLIAFAGGFAGEVERVIAGGPMTGQALGSLEVPVTKGTSVVVVLGPGEAARRIDDDQPCIRCSRCVAGCPMFLEPYAIADRAYLRRWDAAERFHPIDCIECGVCTYVCPTARPLVQLIRLAKSAAMMKGGR